MSDYDCLRNSAGVVDLSHWGRFILCGERAKDALNALVGANVMELYEGLAANTLIVSDTGGVLAIIWIIALPEGFMVICEPPDSALVALKLMETAQTHSLVLDNLSQSHFALTLAGPSALGFAERAFGDEVHSIAFRSALKIGKPSVLAARLGFIGEYELHLFGDLADKDKILGQLTALGVPVVDGSSYPVMMAEMRTLCRARDIPPDISVFECGLAWMVDFRKDDFHGKARLVSRRDEVSRKCVMVIVDSLNSDLGGASLTIDTASVGIVHSAYWSGKLGKVVGIAYLNAELAWPGIEMTVNGVPAISVAAPAFLTQSVLNSLS